jgi:hypothetical protein
MTVSRAHRRRAGALLPGLLLLLVAGTLPGAAQEVSIAPVDPDASPSVEDRLAEAQATITSLRAENERLVGSIHLIDDYADPMEADRQLLLELRKPLPEDRPTAEAYLERLHRLAQLADPATLGQPADRVLENAPAFLDWRDTTFQSQQEADQAFATSGAAGFGARFEDFRDAVLLVVANRLDALLTLQDRAR